MVYQTLTNGSVLSILVNNEFNCKQQWETGQKYIDIPFAVNNKLMMKSLNNQQIKIKELRYLQVKGYSLAKYSNKTQGKKTFIQLQNVPEIKQFKGLAIRKIKTGGGLSTNTNLMAFCCALLNSIFLKGQIKPNLLHRIKSSLYNYSIDLTLIKNHPSPTLSNDQMKKLLVEFFYSLEYSSLENKVQIKLINYPIVLPLFVAFFRRILSENGILNASDFSLKVPTSSLASLVKCFDMNCTTQGNFLLFQQIKFLILEDKNGQILFGCYEDHNETQESTVRDSKNQKQPLTNSTQYGGNQNWLAFSLPYTESPTINEEKIDQFQFISSLRNQSNHIVKKKDGVFEELLKQIKYITRPPAVQQPIFGIVSFGNEAFETNQKMEKVKDKQEFTIPLETQKISYENISQRKKLSRCQSLSIDLNSQIHLVADNSPSDTCEFSSKLNVDVEPKSKLKLQSAIYEFSIKYMSQRNRQNLQERVPYTCSKGINLEINVTDDQNNQNSHNKDHFQNRYMQKSYNASNTYLKLIQNKQNCQNISLSNRFSQPLPNFRKGVQFNSISFTYNRPLSNVTQNSNRFIKNY